MPTKKEVKETVKKITAVVTLISFIIIFYAIINYQLLQQEFSTQVQNYGIPSLFIITLLLDLIPQLITPKIMLAAAMVAGMPTYYAVLTTILGSTLGSIIGFYLGKKYMYIAANILTSKKSTEKLTHFINKYGKIIVPVAAISPIPYLPVILGSMNFSNKNFIVYGLIPRALSFIIVGYLLNLI